MEYIGRNNIEEASKVYSEIIMPGHTVLSIGPSKSLLYDPTLLYASWVLGNKGKLYVVEPQSSKAKSRFMSPEKVQGIGDINHYLKEIYDLRKLGMDLTKPRWMGVGGTATHTGLKENSVDIIIDHHTSIYLAGWISGHQEESARLLSDIYSEYSRVLRDGGKLLLQTNLKRYVEDKSLLQDESLLQRLLTAAGFEVNHRLIKDIFSIPLHTDVTDKIIKSRRRNNQQKLHTVNYLHSLITSRGENSYLQFVVSDDNLNLGYISEDLFIGTKK